jgi:hypothetical protein
MIDKLDRMTLEVAANMLDMAADEFGNHSCNDMMLPLEYLEFVQDMIEGSDDPDEEPHVYFDTAQICVMDWMVMRFCAKMLRQIAEDNDA